MRNIIQRRIRQLRNRLRHGNTKRHIRQIPITIRQLRKLEWLANGSFRRIADRISRHNPTINIKAHDGDGATLSPPHRGRRIRRGAEPERCQIERFDARTTTEACEFVD